MDEIGVCVCVCGACVRACVHVFTKLMHRCVRVDVKYFSCRLNQYSQQTWHNYSRKDAINIASKQPLHIL